MIDIIKEREEIYKMMHDKWYKLGDEEMIRYYEIKLSTIQGLLVEINELKGGDNEQENDDV